MSEEKCYIVVRADISPGYQIVQSAHAAAEHEKLFPGSMAGRTMIVLAVPTQPILTLIYQHLRNMSVPVTAFFEPDVGAYTAIAISPGEYEVLKGLPLAGASISS